MDISSDLVDWAQCEICKKWRRLPLGMNPNTLPEEWVCTMNTWDNAYNSCDAAEEVISIPHENLNLSAHDKDILNSDLQNRSLKGRKKNLNIFPSNNALTQASGSKLVNSQNSNHNQDAVRDLRDNLTPDSLLNRPLIESLSNWSQELKYNTSSSSSDKLEQKFPSCWPSEYQNLDDISLFRNKHFEGFEKSKSKNNNFSGNYEILSNIKISQSFPICVFKNNIINSKVHPLQGRSVITGTEAPVIFKVIGKSINGIFPVLSKSQSIKYSNNHHANNNILSSNNQKNQGTISNINANCLEFIPATRSDWDSPFTDLSNSLFASNSVNFKLSRYRESWSDCNNSYSKLFPEEDCPPLIPNYLNETYFDPRANNSKGLLNEFNEQMNIDILDLLPIFTWLENPNNTNHPIYHKISQSNSSTLSNKVSKKYNGIKNATKGRTKQLDTFQTESINLLRRSSRNANKVQSFENTHPEDDTFSSKGETCTAFEMHNSSFQPTNKEKDGDIGLLEISSEFGDKLGDNTDRDESTIFTSNDNGKNEENSTHNILASVISENTNTNQHNEVDKLEQSEPLEVGKKCSNLSVSKELDISRTDALRKSNLNDDNNSSIDYNNSFTYTDVDSNKSVEDDENVLPVLGSYKRKNKLLLGGKEHECNSIKINDLQCEANEESGIGITKKRLRKKHSISCEIDDKYDINNAHNISSSDLKPKLNEEMSVNSPKANDIKAKGEVNIQVSNNTRGKNSLYIIPRKKSLETTDSTSLTSKNDPWIPKSDSGVSRRDSYHEDYSQTNTQKARNSNWQIDQKRQRLVQGSSSSHRGHYYQNKHRVLTGYEPHKHYQWRKNNSEFVNHHATDFSNSSHCYSQNTLSSSNSIQLVPAGESSNEYSNLKGCLSSKHNSSCSSNAANALNRHNRGR